jgi:hypothetical protein
MKHWLHAFRLRTLAAWVAISTTLVAHAGSGTAKLTCTSASGRTTFTANLQDIVGIFEGGALTIDGQSLNFPEAGANDTGDVVWDPENGVFTITFSHSTPDGPMWFRFWAIPSTFKVISRDRGSPQGAVYVFEGVIEAKEPRPDKGMITPQIRMTCRLEYRI